MIQVFKTDEDYKKWLDGQRLPSGIVVYVSDDETMYFSTNNIKGELKTYKCEKEEVIQYPPLIYSAKSAGSTITVNGQSMTLEQGENITLEYPTAITSVKATDNTALTYIQIPNTVTSINDNAFGGCTALTDFNYNGTVEEWGAITLGTDWNTDAAFTVVHCTDGDVTLEEPIIYPPLVYSAKSAGSTITVNGETVTLEQGDNITLEYPNEITSVVATGNEELTYLQIPNTVTSINDNAFGDCVALTSVTLPDSLTSIGVGAFQCCIGLTSINIPSGVTSISMETFNGCSALASVILPEGLTNIGSSTFMDCTSLASITIPSTVTMIDFEAFNYCEALTDFNFNGTMEQWGAITLGTDWKNNAAFTVVHCTDGDVSLEEPIQPIQPNNLVYSTNAAGSKLTVNGQSVTLEQGENIVLDYPSEITSVTATDNTALTYIQIPNTVTSISNTAFQGCTSLTSINIPDTVTSIEDGAITKGAFRGCSNLVSITIPESVKSIGSNAFQECYKLASITIPEGVTSIGNSTFNGCSSLASITIPESVKSIGSSGFYGCSKLTYITLPDGLTEIDSFIFQECYKLASITIPNAVTKIKMYAFESCRNLIDFNYSGTTAQWGAISLGDSWKSGAPFTVVHCSDGDVTL